MNKKLKKKVRCETSKCVLIKLEVLVETRGYMRSATTAKQNQKRKNPTIFVERKKLKTESGEKKHFSIRITRLKKVEKAVEVEKVLSRKH